MMVLYHYTLAGDLFRMLSRQEEINVVVAKVQDSQQCSCHNIWSISRNFSYKSQKIDCSNGWWMRLRSTILNPFENEKKRVCTSRWKWPRQFEF